VRAFRPPCPATPQDREAGGGAGAHPARLAKNPVDSGRAALSLSLKTPVAKVPAPLGELSFSRIVFGAWRLTDGPHRGSPAKLAETIRFAIDCGITSFDHADIYGGYAVEELFGAALAELGGDRSRIQLISKCGIKLVSPARPEHRYKHYDTSSAHIVASVERSLKNLRTDYLDLLLVHRPDPLMQADEVAGAFDSLRRQGKVRCFGVSNFTPSQVELLASRMTQPLVCNQIELSPLCLSPLTDGTLDQCQRLRMLPMAWSPLAGGRVCTGVTEQEQRVRQALVAIGEELGGAAPDQVALAWIMAHPSMPAPVMGTGNRERIVQQAAACELKLSREQWHRVWSASMGAPVP
jgi:predicted oxidoreductase